MLGPLFQVIMDDKYLLRTCGTKNFETFNFNVNVYIQSKAFFYIKRDLH